jgi:hypothetical protein
MPASPVADRRSIRPVAVEAAVRGAQRVELPDPEFLRRIRAAGCIGYFTPITGRRVQYVGRTGDVHVEPFPAVKA